ncbi:MAG: hypothetical protein J1G02_06520 [Clostridiales bacterium]|nr:hypothetical protein [Clostridiales bacterium]
MFSFLASADNLSPEEIELLRKHRNEFSNLSEEEKELIRKHREQSDKK